MASATFSRSAVPVSTINGTNPLTRPMPACEIIVVSARQLRISAIDGS